MTTEPPQQFAGIDAVEWLNSLCWHDSVLHDVHIVRTNSADAFILTLDLLSDWEKWVSRRAEIHFLGCVLITTEFRGGVTALSRGEMFAEAEASLTGPRREQIAARAPMFLSPDHHEFRFILASTGSTAEVVFTSVQVTYFSAEQSHDAPPPRIPVP